MLDPSGDFASVTDGLEAVTVERSDGSGTTAVAHALRQPVQADVAQRAQGRNREGEAAWHLPLSEIVQPPRPGDTIVDGSGRSWTVLDVSQRALQSRWRCVARNLAVYYRLDTSIDLEEAVLAKGEGGADEATWRIWKAGLSARIEPAIATIGTEHDRQATAERFKIFVDKEIPSDRTLRVRGPDGTLYRITGFRKADGIDALAEIAALRGG